jgi:hypothetical protein
MAVGRNAENAIYVLQIAREAEWKRNGLIQRGFGTMNVLMRPADCDACKS